MTGEASSQLPPEVIELMNTLVDVHAPADLNWWPPAIGWWVAAVLILAAIVFIIKFTIQMIKRKRWTKTLAEELAKIEQASLPDATFCQHINQLLKRVVQVQFSGENVKELSGQAWIDYLQSKLAAKGKAIDLSALGDLSYQPTLSVDRNQVINNVRTWMKACC